MMRYTSRKDYNEPSLLTRIYSGDRGASNERTLRKINAYREDYKKKGGLVSPKRYALMLLAHDQGQNQTPIEESIEYVLNRLCVYGRSQVPIEEKYIVDFLLSDGEVIVECDGAQYHNERNEERDAYLISLGYRVLHLSGKTCLDRLLSASIIESFIESKNLNLRFA